MSRRLTLVAAFMPSAAYAVTFDDDDQHMIFYT